MNLQTIRISAVIPAYNAEQFISETLQSLIGQKVNCLEIIVINDCSKDATREKVNPFLANGVKLITLPENKGVSYARNKGVSVAQGEWILFMDSDDLAEPNLVEKLLDKVYSLQQDQENRWVLVHSASRQVDEKGSFLGSIQRFKQVKAHEILGYEFIRNHVYLSGTLVNKEAFLNVGGFNKQLTHAEDWDLWLRLAQIGGFGYIDEPLFHVRRHTSNVSKDIQAMLNGERKVLNQYSLDFIREAIEQRDLPDYENQLDYVNLLFRMEYWEEGFQLLGKIQTFDVLALNKAFFLKGIYFFKMEQYHEALHCFEQAIVHNEEDGASLNNVAIQYALLGDKMKSKQALGTALQLFPNFMDAQHNLQVLEMNDHLSKVKLTWRQLRPVLIEYKSV